MMMVNRYCFDGLGVDYYCCYGDIVLCVMYIMHLLDVAYSWCVRAMCALCV